jgi:hypothetical protein
VIWDRQLASSAIPLRPRKSINPQLITLLPRSTPPFLLAPVFTFFSFFYPNGYLISYLLNFAVVRLECSLLSQIAWRCRDLYAPAAPEPKSLVTNSQPLLALSHNTYHETEEGSSNHISRRSRSWEGNTSRETPDSIPTTLCH